jgi:hypothetical protein
MLIKTEPTQPENIPGAVGATADSLISVGQPSGPLSTATDIACAGQTLRDCAVAHTVHPDAPECGRKATDTSGVGR